MTRSATALFTTSAIGLALSLTASAVPIPTLSWDATGLPNNTPLPTWNPTINGTSANIKWKERGGDPISTSNTGTSNFGSINAWISTPDYQLNDQNGTAGNGRSWHNHLGDAATDADATWELVFRPGDYTGKHVLFNTGGNGDGTAFVLNGSKLEFRFQDANNANNRIFLDLSLAAPATDFIHVVGIADMDKPTPNQATGSLYVNGVLVDGPTASIGDLNDWDGGEVAELGWGKNIPGTTNYGAADFTGDIALFNYYDSVLTASDVAARKTAVPDGGSAALLLGASLLSLGALRKGASKRAR